MKKTELEATKSLNMVVGREENIEVNDAGGSKANPSVAYVTDNKDIATVDETGKGYRNRSRKQQKITNKGYAWQYDERSCD